MDINQTKLSDSGWNLEMSMEDHILHHQLPLNPIWPTSYPLQLQPPSSSTTAVVYGEQIGQQVVVEEEEEPEEELSAMKEMLYKITAMQPVDIDPATIRKPKRRNVKISDDPQSVAARHRRERISEKIRILQRLVPGGTKMDTASMLDEAIRYVKFLKRQVRVLQQSNNNNHQQQQQQQPPWQQVNTNKAMVSTSSTSMEKQTTAPGFSFGCNGENQTM